MCLARMFEATSKTFIFMHCFDIFSLHLNLCCYHPQGKPFIDVPPANMSVLTGASVSFYCRAIGYPNPTITWKKNLRVVQTKAGTASTVQDKFAITNVKKEDAGIITCEASNEDGTVSKSSFLSVDGQSGKNTFTVFHLLEFISVGIESK